MASFAWPSVGDGGWVAKIDAPIGWVAAGGPSPSSLPAA